MHAVAWQSTSAEDSLRSKARSARRTAVGKVQQVAAIAIAADSEERPAATSNKLLASAKWLHAAMREHLELATWLAVDHVATLASKDSLLLLLLLLLQAL